MSDTTYMPVLPSDRKTGDSFRSSCVPCEAAPISEPRASLRAAESGGMNCALLAWSATLDFKNPTQAAVHYQICANTDEHGRVTISRAAIAKRIGVTDRQVHTVLNELRDRQLVAITKAASKGRGRPSNTYAILIFGVPVSEVDFLKPTSRNGLHEVSIENSDLRKPASGTRLQENALAVLAAVDNASAPYKEHAGARADSKILTKEDQIRSDQIPVSKERIESLIARAGSDCNPTASGLHHGADLNRLLRAGCDWIDDILPAVDKLAASFRQRGKRFSTWELLVEHAIDFRDRRLAGLPAPKPVPFRAKQSNGYRRQPVNGITPLAYTG